MASTSEEGIKNQDQSTEQKTEEYLLKMLEEQNRLTKSTITQSTCFLCFSKQPIMLTN